MLNMLTTFAALSLVGTVVLTLLPDGGLKRTAGMAVGLLTLLCWSEGILSLLGLDFSVTVPGTVLVPSSITVETAAFQAINALSTRWEAAP